MAEGDFDPTKDSYGKGEPIPKGMPSADTGVASGTSSAPSPNAMPSVGGSDDLKSLTAGLADLQRAKIDAETRGYQGIEGQMGKDQQAVEEARKNAGIEPGEFKPWNAKVESAKHMTDPIVAFGSLGSVMGILASSFTHEPLVNAMSASAAAIDAIKKGDAEEYNRAYKAWEANTKNVLEKHKIQHEQFEDAITLLKTNMAAGEAKMRVLAAKFGDQKSLYLLEHGMDKDLIDLQNARDMAALKMAKILPEIEMNNAKINSLYAPRKDPDTGETIKYDRNHPQTEQSQRAFHLWQVEQAEIKRIGHSIVGGILTPGRQQAQAIQSRMNEIKEEAKAKGKPISDADAYTQAAQEIKTQTATPTGNRLDDLRGKVNQVTLAETTIGHIEDMLKKHNVITGLGGKVTRPAEVVGNIFGSNETDRKQFERWVSELQEIAPRILLDSKGRPLSSEAGRVETIIAGLRPGDTTANSARAYYELRRVLQQIMDGLTARLKGGSDESAAPDEKPAPSGGNDWYKSAPLVH